MWEGSMIILKLGGQGDAHKNGFQNFKNNWHFANNIYLAGMLTLSWCTKLPFVVLSAHA